MKRVRSFIKEKKEYCLAFLIPILSLILLFVLLRVSYSDQYTVLISDMKAQYVSLFHYLKGILQGKHSLFYSFNSGLGNNMFGTFCYYLISPINFIVLFFSDARFHYALLFISFIKIGFAGATMFYYLKKHDPGRKDVHFLLFSTTYVLISYNICYYFNILWLDSLYLLPLMCYGIDQIIEKKKSLLYGISLLLAILFNYYTICIFSVLYYIYSILNRYSWKKEKKEIIETTVLYGVTFLFAGFSSMFILLPLFINIFNAVKSGSEPYRLVIELMSGRWKVGLEYHVPGLKTGLIISISSILLWILFFRNQKKICSSIMNFYFKKEEVWNYLFVGICTTLLNVLCYAIFSKLLHIHYIISTIMAWILSVFFAYVANKKAVFKTTTNSKKELIKECFQFFQYRILSLGLEVVFMYLLVNMLNFPDLISKFVVNVVVIIANYFFSKLFVFKESR